MIPVRNESGLHGIPFATIAFIAACVGVYIFNDNHLETGGLVPINFIYALFHPLNNLSDALRILLLSFFLHGGTVHLVSNMWFLWIFGSIAENTVGSVRFASVYLLCGILSMVIQVASSPLSSIPIVGASGAIAGIMGMSLVKAPLAKILVWFPPIFFFRIPAFIFLLLWFGIQYVNLRQELPGGGGVAWWAHVGGYISGVLLTFFFAQQTNRRDHLRMNSSRKNHGTAVRI